jgi:hypothetical protein
MMVDIKTPKSAEVINRILEQETLPICTGVPVNKIDEMEALEKLSNFYQKFLVTLNHHNISVADLEAYILASNIE